MTTYVSDERLENALKTAAKLFLNCEEEPNPFAATFETLEKEVQKRQNITSSKQRAAQLLAKGNKENSTQSSTQNSTQR